MGFGVRMLVALVRKRIKQRADNQRQNIQMALEMGESATRQETALYWQT